MQKSLSQMTLEELWQLFPIQLSPHRTDWETQYENERDFLAGLFNQCIISHIGSTAIAGICAKPIVDILLELPHGDSMETARQILMNNGYLCMSEEPNRLSFNKGYTPDGFADKVFHLHLRFTGDHDEIFFRDYLNTHPDTAREYEALKKSLKKQFEHNRDAYTDGKSAFVKRITRLAKEKKQQ